MFREHLLKFRKIGIECIRSEVALFQKFIDILDKSDLAKFALIVETRAGNPFRKQIAPA